MNYLFLKDEKAPKLLVEAYKLVGVKETLGKENNPTILGWADKIGLKNQYKSDETPWCGLFMAYVCHMAGKQPVMSPLWARNWLNFGTSQTVAMLGDILVFSRGAKSGHVGIYVGEDDDCYHVLAGNQGDEVSIKQLTKARLLGIRRTDWKTAQPANVRVIKLTSNGQMSQNEV